MHPGLGETREREYCGGHLDFSEGDEEGLLELGVQPENPGSVAEVAVRCSESIHGCPIRFKRQTQNNASEISDNRSSELRTELRERLAVPRKVGRWRW